MILLLIYVVVVVMGTWFYVRTAKRRHWRPEDTYIPLALVWVIILFSSLIIGPWTFKITTGLMPGYSEGERIGYVTKLTSKGVIWKTWEGEMQMGTGELAALQEPFHFSVIGSELWFELRHSQGKRVRLEYRRWLVMPYHVGSSGYQILDIEILEDVK